MTDIRHRMVALLPRLRAFARALARTPDAADDLVQATCEKALRAADTWTEGTRLDSWMYRIMQNLWIDQQRAAKPAVAIDDPEVEADVSNADGRRTTEARLTLSNVQHLIAGLPEDQRTVLVLVCVQELSYREVADILGLPMGTVMSRLARARRSLTDALTGVPDSSREGAAS